MSATSKPIYRINGQGFAPDAGVPCRCRRRPAIMNLFNELEAEEIIADEPATLEQIFVVSRWLNR